MGAPRPTGRRDSLVDVPGVRAGHAVDPRGTTGVTVVRFPRAAPTVLLALGGASATYDTGSLELAATFGRRWAIFFAGGSVFGLDAARGIRETLLAEGEGHQVFGNPHRVAPVSGATLFDLPRSARETLPDYRDLGAAAARAAGRSTLPDGRRGAGAGALVGKYLGRGHAAPGGVGSASRRIPGIGVVGALVVVNAVGAVWDTVRHRWAAGARDEAGRIVPPDPALLQLRRRAPGPSGTTLTLVVTNVNLERPQLHRAAQVAAGGLARSVIPVATATDGDVLFLANTGEGRRLPPPAYPGAWADRVGWVAAELIGRAVVRAVGNRPASRRPTAAPTRRRSGGAERSPAVRGSSRPA